jgi:hypothetical protein
VRILLAIGLVYARSFSSPYWPSKGMSGLSDQNIKFGVFAQRGYHHYYPVYDFGFNLAIEGWIVTVPHYHHTLLTPFHCQLVVRAIQPSKDFLMLTMGRTHRAAVGEVI